MHSARAARADRTCSSTDVPAVDESAAAAAVDESAAAAAVDESAAAAVDDSAEPVFRLVLAPCNEEAAPPKFLDAIAAKNIMPKVKLNNVKVSQSPDSIVRHQKWRWRNALRGVAYEMQLFFARGGGTPVTDYSASFLSLYPELEPPLTEYKTFNLYYAIRFPDDEGGAAEHKVKT